MSEHQNSNLNKKVILFAPDGGWGYLICIAVTTHFVVTTAFVGCFGMIFKDFIQENDMTSSEVTLLMGINAMCLALAGFIASPLLKILSMRKLAFMGALIYDLGVLGTVFVKSQFPLFICYGIMQGAGWGLTYNLACTILNVYFVKRRLLANSIVQTITALCAMFAPTFCSWSLNKYGFRGTLLLITGISLQNLIASALMQPVKWHMKKVEVMQQEARTPILVEEKSTNPDTPMIILTDIEKNSNQSIEKIYEFPPDSENSKGLRKILEQFIDFSLYKTFVLSCACLGPSLTVFADSIYIIILPQALYAAGWDQDAVAWALSSLLLGDLALRFSLIFVSKWLTMFGSQEIFMIGILIGLISRLGMLWSANHIAIISCIILIGVAHGIFSVLISVVVADVVTPEKFTSAIGITLLLYGTLNLTLAPAIGAVRDFTHSYPTVFYILACIFAIVLLFWSIEILYKRSKHKRRSREESLKKINKTKSNKK